MWQSHRLELLKNCDLTILYHSSIANIIVGALSWKSTIMDSLVHFFDPGEALGHMGSFFGKPYD